MTTHSHNQLMATLLFPGVKEPSNPIATSWVSYLRAYTQFCIIMNSGGQKRKKKKKGPLPEEVLSSSDSQSKPKVSGETTQPAGIHTSGIHTSKLLPIPLPPPVHPSSCHICLDPRDPQPQLCFLEEARSNMLPLCCQYSPR